MVFVLGQIYFIAQKEDGGWMQLLVFVVMAVIWVIGGILNAKKNKEEQQQEQPGPATRQPARPKRLLVRPEPGTFKINVEKATRPSAFIQKINIHFITIILRYTNLRVI